ncbi:MAG: hypothetical protein MSH60_01750 [Ruminococcus sp.]|nr:hypothetical protein [Ruminococcus sp.]
MVKVTKWDKKKKNEQNKRKYKLYENLRYILSEIWKSQPLMVVLLLVGLIAIVAESLFTTFTGKYVVLNTYTFKSLSFICDVSTHRSIIIEDFAPMGQDNFPIYKAVIFIKENSSAV